MIDLTNASIEQLRTFLLKDNPLTEQEQMAITDNLDGCLNTIGFLYDKALGVNPNKGQFCQLHGTPNHKSMKYKLRKAAGYTYP